MIAVRRQITSSQLPARGLLFREVRYGLEEELETFIHKKINHKQCVTQQLTLSHNINAIF